MIFYFSGTGNSHYVAKKVAENTGERLISIEEAIKEGQYTYSLHPEERIGFVMPVYAWDMPNFIKEFVQKLNFESYSDQYAFGIATCGGMTGYTIGRLKELLAEKGIKLSGRFSIIMPGNYTVGYGAKPIEVETKILDKAEIHLDQIINWILGRREIKNLEGIPMPDFLSKVISYGFNKKKMDTKDFFAKENCISCGKCAKNCPIQAIEMKNGRPNWIKEKCTKCLRCINTCPVEAIEFGKSTQGKRRYQNPRV